MICPNCGASNSTRATFCRRCHQRLPVAGLAAGVTYPRRRNVAGGGGRLPIIAALALAIAGLIIGALLFSFVGKPGPTLIAGASSTPVSSLPVFVQPTPTPGPATPTTFQSFPGLLTPTPFFSPTDTPLFTPPPSESPTPTPTPTATPTKKPTPPPTPTPTPTPTATPVAFDCSTASGGKSGSVTLTNTDNTTSPPTGKVWCLDTVTITPISQNGRISLYRNQKEIAHADCDTTGCTALDGTWNPPMTVTTGQTLKYLYNCPASGSCDPIRQATITVNFRQFAAP